MTIRFAKAHAYGNDFLYVPRADMAGVIPDAVARLMCDRHTGVGADGLIVYDTTPGGATMRLYNADGGIAEVSGNGVRGLGALLLQETPGDRAQVTVATDGGDKQLVRLGRDGSRQTFTASMGVPTGLRRDTIQLGTGPVQTVLLSIGNPHCVLLGDLPDDARFHEIGAALERHPLFPNRTNVEFVHVETPGRLRIRLWERGVGPTSSSGTGSCASLVAAAAFGGAAREAEVIAPGGSQRVEWREDEGVFLTGWAEVVCEGQWVGQIPRTA